MNSERIKQTVSTGIMRLKTSVLLTLGIFVCIACSTGTYFHQDDLADNVYILADPQSDGDPDKTREVIEAIISVIDDSRAYPRVSVTNPLDGTLFPIDIASPDIEWKDADSGALLWLVRVTFEGEEQTVNYLTRGTSWTPDRKTWELIKEHSLNGSAVLSVFGIDTENGITITGRGQVSFATSRDSVGAPILFMQMPLPFAFANTHPDLFRWLLADLSSYEKPPVVLEKMPVCGNCHSFSRDGTVIGMDIDYRGDKGGYVMAQMGKTIDVTPEDIISWNDLKGSDDSIIIFGFFPKVSPDGSYVIATVQERSFFIRLNDPAFSQFFFLAAGVLSYYMPSDKTFHLLAGADDPAFVQTCPDWSHDGKYVAFSRAPVNNDLVDLVVKKALNDVDHDTPLSELNERYQIQYDLYRVPFNNGRGGVPEPIAGASGNGMSNYFPRYSPDGKWIVFCKSKSGLALQPDSRLYIIPSGGGRARELIANRHVMNSWHSWSPNGQWLVFSSKETGPFTVLYLCHIDEEGNDSVPVLLSGLQNRNFSNLVPEFGNIKPEMLQRISIKKF
ncbi:MAG: PD40 domain-containing protein [Deltaproteobacteria bacterium]|nr:PD40 domain-containing protein [Deltaproteobacteria bacterium]